MAEFVVSMAAQRIADLLIHEADPLCEVREEVEKLESELKRIVFFLKDADFKQEQDDHYRNGVAEIRNLAYDAEDVIENFVLKTASEGGLRVILKKFTSIFSESVHLQETRSHINTILMKIQGISSSIQGYDITEAKSTDSVSYMQLRVGRRSFHYAEEEIMTTFGGSSRDLTDKLMMEEDQLCVISIAGVGGLGKTTLAKKVYNQIDVKRKFDFCAWVDVPHKSTAKGVLSGLSCLSGLLEKFGSSAIGMRDEDLVDRLYNLLKEKQYLVVLDDIQEVKEWDCLKLAFPNGKRGSKVLLITQYKDVASYVTNDPLNSLLEPSFLTADEAWKLLCRKAFVPERRNYLQGFEKLGKEMVKHCEGLPLTISLLGGMLATKKTLNEWEAVQTTITSHHSAGMNEILALSYQDLPSYLKPCFLYLSHFPDGYEIRKKELIRLWIAEGFIPSLKADCEAKIEGLAEQYFQQLIIRSLIQVNKMDHTGREIKTCRVHDLVRELCVKKGREEDFIGVIDDHSSLKPSTIRLRRIALRPESDPIEHIQLVNDHENFRSFSLLAADNHQETSLKIIEHIPIHNSFRLLRVMILHSPKASESLFIPNEIGNLIHLRYLRLNCYARDLNLPQPIGDLRNLRTLHVRCYSFTCLPNVIFKLQRLRHLVLASLTGRNQSYRIDTLKNLQTLKLVTAENLIRNNSSHKLTELRNVGIEFNTTEEAETILESPIMKSGHLRSLHMCIQNSPYPDLESLSNCDQLSKLKLEGEIPEETFSVRHNLEYLPESIVKLTLGNSNLKQDPMSILEKLPNLKFLSLEWYAFEGNQMVCSALGFPQLELLTLDHMANLEDWKIEEGAMSNLKNLQMHDLPELRELPEGLIFLNNLQELKLVAMKRAFQNRIRDKGVEGEDYYKIQHIPSILVLP